MVNGKILPVRRRIKVLMRMALPAGRPTATTHNHTCNLDGNNPRQGPGAAFLPKAPRLRLSLSSQPKRRE
jgi:hypothetical protein